MKNSHVKKFTGCFVLVAALAVTVLPASAQSTLTWDITPGTVGAGNGTITGGGGTWNSTNGNWTTDGGTNNIAWDNTTPSLNTAILDATGIGGTSIVTLSEDINLKSLSITNLRNSAVQKYTITNSTLAFASGGSITVHSLDQNNFTDYCWIHSAISGAPNVVFKFSPYNNQLVFAPTSGSQALGTFSGDGVARLAGSTTGNSLVGLSNKNSKLKFSSGTWTVTGTANSYEHFIEGTANVIVSTGSLQYQDRGISMSGGTLHLNNDNALKDNNATSAYNYDFYITGGTIDNSSGSPRTLTNNPPMHWGGNWTFNGSNGADSDLNTGTGIVTLYNATRQVTVQPAATTLTIGGAITNNAAGYGLTKAGAGTLELRGINTYTGATTITNGTLAGVVGGSCTNSDVTVAVTGALGVKVTNTNNQWTCKSLTVSAGTEAKLKFAFTGVPSTTVAPLKITGAVTFTGVPTVVLEAPELTLGTYPLLVKGDGAALAVPALSSSVGGNLVWSGDNTTLNLIVPPAGTVIIFR